MFQEILLTFRFRWKQIGRGAGARTLLAYRPPADGPSFVRTQARSATACRVAARELFSECLLQNKPTPKQTFSTSKMFV